jgi:hypothetical protein
MGMVGSISEIGSRNIPPLAKIDRGLSREGVMTKIPRRGFLTAAATLTAAGALLLRGDGNFRV